ncbi:bifunctional 23S rRNA (guanine(2069)-N(7))-methyltransferase RlmK/23S rRNA (guanine(2445)-N(2))-methyltransferase RlmL [Methylonatrum kenyense]|nr:bifunctional 23S rRNA (guanine(2069)-N(7))-methyltransferase RlmK/23S rRNA (guanine(2445)-N(2))-methyltransferase RlmL [Methylonatrum kenyense]MCK8516075.1 bifunctional 23S rRNA (guanine(2069)-N(7))-methyltransferase RlmK/23S rRNA (guanine(2445)-N(2))-methyltransferase RlmL [Methylonatrum kenyense]
MLSDELRQLGIAEPRQQRGGVSCSLTLEQAYRVCLWSRIGNRVLLPLATFPAPDPEALYQGLRTVTWLEHLAADGSLAIDVTGVRPAIGHSRFAAQKAKDAIVDQIREAAGSRPTVNLETPDCRLHLHLAGEQGTISLDLSGDSLHRRGYREPGTAAPLKENLAAAVLVRGDWPAIAAAGGSFYDPFCGSGTLAIEAAWMAADVAPGLLRVRYGLHGWRQHDDTCWKGLLDEALERQEQGMQRLPVLVATDHDPRAVRQALDNVRRAGLAGHVHVERRELDELAPSERHRPGLVAMNPPYGERLAQNRELVPLYARIGDVLRSRFAGWQAVLLTGAEAEIGLRPDRSWKVFNGPIRCRLERFLIADEGGSEQNAAAEPLVNRLRKNRRQLSSWLKRHGVTNYRLYDADIPEFALAVDVYGSRGGDWLHVQEYQAPSTVDARQSQTRLRAALAALPGALDVPAQRLVYKVRSRQRGDSQYRRQASEGRWLEVTEGNCRLLVNLTDYLDTGLFLDHRPVRHWLGGQANGKRLLNLFCYTGAATVHAAVGGASRSVSVDMSRTYLDWLQRNLELNGMATPAHEIIRADCRDWLQQDQGEYDLIFLDPPSFSNSKRMDGTLDIQRDHVDLIRAAMARLATDGTLIFSTNRRRFRLDREALSGLTVEDRTAWSIPKDFARNQRIHQCYFIRRAE